jgi:hypothetical protein
MPNVILLLNKRRNNIECQCLREKDMPLSRAPSTCMPVVVCALTSVQVCCCESLHVVPFDVASALDGEGVHVRRNCGVDVGMRSADAEDSCSRGGAGGEANTGPRRRGTTPAAPTDASAT